MRLSEAIALGRTLVKPASSSEWHPDGAGCARGMALEAIGKRRPVLRYTNLEIFKEEWPWTFRESMEPSCDCYAPGRRDNAASVIAHLFDVHVEASCDWTLDQLIDWVRSVEPEEAPSPTVAVAGSCSKSEVGA